MRTVIKIPYTDLSESALGNLIDEFITRDSNVTDGTIEQKRERVMNALRTGKAQITFDSESETATIWESSELEKLH